MKNLSFVVRGAMLAFPAVAADVSMAVPGAQTVNGQKVLTFIAKDPPGQRCNGNLQVAAEIARTSMRSRRRSSPAASERRMHAGAGAADEVLFL